MKVFTVHIGQKSCNFFGPFFGKLQENKWKKNAKRGRQKGRAKRGPFLMGPFLHFFHIVETSMSKAVFTTSIFLCLCRSS